MGLQRGFPTAPSPPLGGARWETHACAQAAGAGLAGAGRARASGTLQTPLPHLLLLLSPANLPGAGGVGAAVAPSPAQTFPGVSLPGAEGASRPLPSPRGVGRGDMSRRWPPGSPLPMLKKEWWVRNGRESSGRVGVCFVRKPRISRPFLPGRPTPRGCAELKPAGPGGGSCGRRGGELLAPGEARGREPGAGAAAPGRGGSISRAVPGTLGTRVLDRHPHLLRFSL